jgi:hypothetical protein
MEFVRRMEQCVQFDASEGGGYGEFYLLGINAVYAIEIKQCF